MYRFLFWVQLISWMLNIDRMFIVLGICVFFNLGLVRATCTYSDAMSSFLTFHSPPKIILCYLFLPPSRTTNFIKNHPDIWVSKSLFKVCNCTYTHLMYKISIKGLTLCMRIKITTLYKGKNMFKVGCCSKVYTSYFEHVSTSYSYRFMILKLCLLVPNQI